MTTVYDHKQGYFGYIKMKGKSDVKNNTKDIKYLQNVQNTLKKIGEENIIDSVINLSDPDFPYSYDLLLSQLLYINFVSQLKDFDIYFQFMKDIEDKINHKIIDVFLQFLLQINTQDSIYLLEKLLEQKMVDISKVLKEQKSLYFSHYMSKEEINELYGYAFYKYVSENYEELSKNDWELHKQLIKEGHNPNEIAKIIRNDEVEKLQEISTQNVFDFNQKIEPSLYERCDFINKYSISLIDYAAFFGSVKCFKYLLMNGANIENTGKYAAAGGNEEIIHLCEQNHSSFEGAYETAIGLSK